VRAPAWPSLAQWLAQRGRRPRKRRSPAPQPELRLFRLLDGDVAEIDVRIERTLSVLPTRRAS
jgi:hypothetical protein